MTREQLSPVLGRADVKMGDLLEMARCRGKQDIICVRADVCNCALGVEGGQVLQCLDAGDQVVPPGEGVDDRGPGAVRLEVLADALQGKRRGVGGVMVRTAVTKEMHT